jgi:hypothetical protein
MHDPLFEIQRFMIRGVYLSVAAMLLAYIGVHQERMWNEITALASWPGGGAPRNERTLVKVLLEHASTVMSAPRVLMVWEESEEPWLNLAFWSQGGLQLTREDPNIFGDIVSEPLAERNFLCFDASLPRATVLYDHGDGFTYYDGEAVLHPEIHARYSFGTVLALKLLPGASLKGVKQRVFSLWRLKTAEEFCFLIFNSNLLDMYGHGNRPPAHEDAPVSSATRLSWSHTGPVVLFPRLPEV